MKPAILIIDVLEDFFKEGHLREHRHELTQNINGLTVFGRAHKIPIIWVRQEYKEDLSDAPPVMRRTHYAVTIEKTRGCRILEELVRESTDYEIVKKRYSAFFGTNLDELLNTLGIDTLFIGGVNTHACVRTTLIDAFQRDYAIILATDCTNSTDEEHHRISLNYLTRNDLISQGKTNGEIFEMYSSLEGSTE